MNIRFSIIKWSFFSLIVLAFLSGCSQDLAISRDIPANFVGKFLAASDADMLGGAYADGVLNKAKGVADSLSLVEVKEGNARVISQRFASNSVISWPSVVAWGAGNKLAYVAETRGVYEGEEQKMENVFVDFPKGQKISVFDYENPEAPVLIQEREIGENIQGVAVNKEGTLLVAGSTEKGKELIIVRLNGGKLGDTFYFTHPDIERSEEGNLGFRTIEFHPTENIIAANLNNDRLVFFEVVEEKGKLDIRQIGEVLNVAKHWSVGNWHPSGKYFILSDVAWGEGVLGFVFNGKGKLVSVAFDKGGVHKVVSETKVGRSPEGFDLSPNGNYAIVANMRRTYMPPKGFWFVSKKDYASLSLVKVNPNNGQLTRLGKDYNFEGMLPEDAIFDSESNSIAVAVFHKREELEPTQGWIDFWEVENDQLIKTNRRLYLTRGVHNLLLLED